MIYPKIVYGFHGCDLSTREKILSGEAWIPSNNSYDWLGSGIYFWEFDELRALSWAEELAKYGRNEIKTPAVIGAKIDLMYCLDLNVQESAEVILLGYQYMIMRHMNMHLPIPKNERVSNDDMDWKRRVLDRTVIQAVHDMNEEYGYKQYDSVRCSFLEGQRVYPGSGFRTLTHVQLCIKNPECILEVF